MRSGVMSRKELREAVEDRHKSLMIMNMLDSEVYVLDEFLEDLRILSKVKTFKEICEMNSLDYREEIKHLKQGVKNEFN
jgi:hypothetical protein